MDSNQILGLIILAWLIASVFMMALLIRRGRHLAKVLSEKHPEAYEALGRPLPGFFHNMRRGRFSQFLARREYEKLGDPALSARFDDYRRAETRLLKYILFSLAIAAAIIFTVRNNA